MLRGKPYMIFMIFIAVLIAAQACLCRVSPVAASQPVRSVSNFRDVSPSDWFYTQVKQLYEDGIINGVTANSYAPYAEVKTSEVAALIIRYLGCERAAEKNRELLINNKTEGAEFWYSGYIQAMCDMGIFDDADIIRYNLRLADAGAAHISRESAAAIDAPLKRMDMVKFIARSFELERGKRRAEGPLPREISGTGQEFITGGGYDEATLEKIKPLISDFGDIPEEYQIYFLKCYYNGIVRGNERREMLPNNNMRRSELARIIASVMYFDLRDADIRDIPEICAVSPSDRAISSVDGKPILKKEKAEQILREQAKYTVVSDLGDRININIGQNNIIPAGFLFEAYVYKYDRSGVIYETGRVNCAANADEYFPKSNVLFITKSDSRSDFVGYIYFVLRDLRRNGEVTGAVMFNINTSGVLVNAPVYNLP